MTTHAGHDHPATPAARAACRRAVPTRTMPEGTYTDRCGFPLRPCDRCGGDGQYPSSAYSGMCLGCSGTGWKDYNKSSRTQRLAYDAAVVAAQTVSPEDVAVGDRVLTSGGMLERDRWETVLEIIIAEPAFHGSSTRDGVTTIYTQTLTVRTNSRSMSYSITSDGEIRGTIRRAAPRIDSAPYLARIKY